ncbi:MAG: LamG domain-containing protein, partial [Actinobacteria bacterium]|nr:LamG domain-containing protein [Actinomycetota bacterium]
AIIFGVIGVIIIAAAITLFIKFPINKTDKVVETAAVEESAVEEPSAEESEEKVVETGIDWFQTENIQPIISFQPKQSKELADNRIGADIGNWDWVEGGNNTELYNDLLRGIQDLGYKWVRTNFWSPNPLNWQEVLRTPGVYSIPQDCDDFITSLSNDGVNIVLTLSAGAGLDVPGWGVLGDREPEGWFNTQEDCDRFIDYVHFMVQHFKGRIKYYEIWTGPGELDGRGSVTMSDYINLVKQVVPIIRQLDPEARIVLPARGQFYAGDRQELQVMLQSEIATLIDTVSWSPFSNGESPLTEYSQDTDPFYWRDPEPLYWRDYPSNVQSFIDNAASWGFNGEYMATGMLWRTATPLPEQSNPPGMVSYWKFDEGSGNIAYDSVGPNDGTIYGATWANGIVNGALSFDGINDYVDVGTDPSLNLVNQLTIEAWVYYNVEAIDLSVFGSSSPNPGRVISFRSNAFWLEENYNTFEQCIDQGIAPIREWVHYVGTWDGKTMKVYWNGVLKNSKNWSGTLPPAGDNLIGMLSLALTDSGAGEKGWYMNGLIDELAIYNRALSLEEIQQRTFVESEGPLYYTDIVAAKYAARAIIMHLGLGFTMVNNLIESIPDPDVIKNVPTYCIIQNLSTVMAGAKQTSLQINVQSDNTNIKSYSFSLPDGETLVALWTDDVAVDEDSDVEVNMTFYDFTAQDVMGIDILKDFQQPITANNENGNFIIKNLIVRDYPLILRISK